MTKMEKLMKDVEVMANSPDRGDAERLIKKLTLAIRRRNAWIALRKKHQNNAI